MEFPTKIDLFGKNILVTGYDKNGKKFFAKEKYKPYLFRETKKKTDFKSFPDNKYLERVDFDSTFAAWKYIKEAKNYNNPYYGMSDFTYQYYSDTYRNLDVDDIDTSLIRTWFLDTEMNIVDTPEFPDIDKVNNAIELISIVDSIDRVCYQIGTIDYDNKISDATYFRAKDEAEMYYIFLDLLKEKKPDIFSGFNIKFFDIPYLINRMLRVIGEDAAKISPWERFEEKQEKNYGRYSTTFSIAGISILDMMHAYEKFAFDKLPSYSLNSVSSHVLNAEKLDYSSWGSLKNLQAGKVLYKGVPDDELTEIQKLAKKRDGFDKDSKEYKKLDEKVKKISRETYCIYNIKDSKLVIEIEDKLKLIDLIIIMSLEGKYNFEDAFGTIKPWDNILQSRLKEHNYFVDNTKKKIREDKYVGAFVKPVTVGLHEWVVSFDINSLYPTIIRQFNLGPETLVEDVFNDPRVKGIENLSEKDKEFLRSISNKLNYDYLNLLRNLEPVLKGTNLSFASNGRFFLNDFKSLFSSLMGEYYAERNRYKKLMNDIPKSDKSQADKRLLYHNRQMSYKIKINAFYGMLGSLYCRWYKREIAEAITMSGRNLIHAVMDGINNYLNKSAGTEDKDFIIAGDTDSMYIRLSDFVKDIPEDEKLAYMNSHVVPALEKHLEKMFAKLAKIFNCAENVMKMKRENIADRAIWTAKKNYVLRVVDAEGYIPEKPIQKITGMAVIKGATPVKCKPVLQKCFEYIVDGNKDAYYKEVKKFKKEFFKMNFEDVSSPRSVTDMALKENRNAFHVVAANAYNKYKPENFVEIKDGDTVRLCYMVTPNLFGSAKVMAMPIEESYLSKDMRIDEFIDYKTQFDKMFLSPLRKLTDIVGWTVEYKRTLADLGVV